MTGAVKKTVVDLFYDILSPYSYIAFTALSRFSKKSNIDLHLQPTLLGGIIQKTGNISPMAVPAKFKYFSMDLERMTKYYNVSYKPPVNSLGKMHLKGSLTLQRLLTAIKEKHPQYLESATNELYQDLWLKDINLTEIESLKLSFRNVGISEEEINDLFTHIQDPEIKQKLKDTSQSAVDYGAFGLPFFVAHLEEGPEVYFGCDRLPILANRLNALDSDYISQ